VCSLFAGVALRCLLRMRFGLALLLATLCGACDGGMSLKKELGNPVPLIDEAAKGDKVRVSGAAINPSVYKTGPTGGNTQSGSQPFLGAESRGTGQFLATDGQIARTKTDSGEDAVTLNLVNVPVAQAAKAVLGDILGLNYTVSDKVTGNVTIQTSKPISHANLIGAFEAALKSSGGAVIRTGDTYSIVPAAEVSQAGSPITVGGSSDKPGVSTQVVPLQFIAASEMKRLIEPIAHQGAVLKADDQRNLILISGSGRELADTADIIKLFDVDWMKGMSVALVPIKTSDPEIIVGELETIFGVDGKEAPLKGLVRFLPNRRLSAVLVMSSRPAYLDKARDWIGKLDHAAEQGEQQLYVYKIQNRAAVELASILQKLLTTDGDASPNEQQSVAPRYDPVMVAAPVENGTVSPNTPPGTHAMTGPPQAGASALAIATAQPEGPASTPGGSKSLTFQVGKLRIVADEPNNSLLIEALPKEYSRIIRILHRIDVQPTQVMLEAVIAEVTLNDELKFGIKWYFEKKNSSFTLSNALSGAVASAFPGFSYFFSTNSVQVALDTLSSVTKVNVVSAPSIMAMDNRKATLQIGDQVPIVTQTAQGVDVNSRIVNAVTLKDTGVILAVTPRVNDAGRVVLQIEQEVSNVSKTTSSGIDSPTIQQRKVQTTVVVSDGEVLALGGLIQQRDNVTKSQIPLLGDLPLVGTAFRQKSDSIDRTELVIFIRPSVVRNTNEARQVTEEFRSRINLQPLANTRDERQYERDFKRIAR
jgi:general secretion pathway protein D